MDPDSSLAALILGLSIVFCGLLSLTEGYLWPRLRGGPAAEDSLLHPALWDETTRSLIKAGLIAAAVASGAYLLLSLDFTWWAVALGALGLLVFLPVFQGVLTGLGARLGTKARIPAMMLWPLVLPASLLSPSADIRRFGSVKERRGHDGHLCPVQPHSIWSHSVSFLRPTSTKSWNPTKRR